MEARGSRSSLKFTLEVCDVELPLIDIVLGAIESFYKL
jgi:hypothetical protein